MNRTDLPSAAWHKSSRSDHQRSCVEVAELDGGRRAVRDSKDPTGPVLIASGTEWLAFTAAIRAGEFD